MLVTYCFLAFLLSCFLAFLLTRLENDESEKVKEIILDGFYIQSRLDLYCYIGEEVCGVLGYMGANFSAMRDCLDGSFRPIQYPLRIVWKNFNYSKEKFDQNDDIQYLIDLLSQYADLQVC